MAKHIKHDKVIRTYDGIDREESTAGLMFLRIFVALVIILFIGGAAALFMYNLQREAENSVQSAVPTVDDGAFYQKYDTDVEDRLLEYCGGSYSISPYYKAELDWYNDVQVSSLMLTSLQRMAEDAARSGIVIEVAEGYISYEDCNTRNKSLRMRFEEEGETPAEAELHAAKVFPPGGSNEFTTGMLIRVCDDESDVFAKTDTYAWLYKHGINYGFINRYTAEKSDITGIEEDLAVYRFVGTENAQKMRSFGMCLEEYSEYTSAR